MTKISVVFKPSRKSWITGILQEAWFYKISYKDLKEKDYFIKNSKKIIIKRVPYDDIWELYENCNKYFNENAIVVLTCCITDLFE